MKSFLISCLDSRIESDGTLYGRYLFGPFHRGKGVTIATALRRSLLGEVSGLAVTAVEVVGVPYEYAIIPGTHESVFDLILNLKKLVFTSAKKSSNRKLGYTGYITARGPATITGHDLRLPPGIQCVNPDQVLATVATGGNLNLKLRISYGKNYLVQPGRSTHSLQVPRIPEDLKTGKKMLRKPLYTIQRNVFPVDAVFMPVLRVNYALQSDEHVLNFPLKIKSRDVTERIIFEIWTDGTLTPREGLDQAVRELIRSFSLFKINGRRANFKPKRNELLLGIRRARRVRSYRYLRTLRGVTPKSVTDPFFKSIYTPNPFKLLDIGILPLNPNQLTHLKAKNIHRLGNFRRLSYPDIVNLPEITEGSLFTLLCHLRTYGFQLQTSPRRTLERDA